MRRIVAAAAALSVACTLAGCSHDRSTDPVTVASGATWSLVTFHNADGALCLEIRDAAGRAGDDFGGGCGGWSSPDAAHAGDAYIDGPGPGDGEFAFGPLGSAVTTVEATAPGREPLVAPARPLPAGAGAAKFFVLPLPDAATVWTYTATNAAGAPEPLGL
ncbi:hypothetical protein [Actinoplanes sp. NPDC026623]|uniref:hypothetical protein n=1 Tax=Actinoplanes sp. NPDC026623 TaxID=3155610 RepID=UPI0033D99AE5